MYLAQSKSNPLEVHSFTWTEDSKLIICGKEVNPNDWEIIEVVIVSNREDEIYCKHCGSVNETF